jgi:hypothetical protein
MGEGRVRVFYGNPITLGQKTARSLNLDAIALGTENHNNRNHYYVVYSCGSGFQSIRLGQCFDFPTPPEQAERDDCPMH